MLVVLHKLPTMSPKLPTVLPKLFAMPPKLPAVSLELSAVSPELPAMSHPKGHGELGMPWVHRHGHSARLRSSHPSGHR